MSQLCLLVLRLHVALLASVGGRAPARRRDERGDVPGWVLVTVMTAGLVMAIWGVARGELQAMLSSALGQVQ